MGCAALLADSSEAEVPPTSNASTAFKGLFVTKQRGQCKQLCGWRWGNRAAGESDEFAATLAALQARGEHERAAAIAVFSLQWARAARLLRDAATTLGASARTPAERERAALLRMGSVLVAGFQATAAAGALVDVALVREACAPVLAATRGREPYFHAMLAFLVATDLKDMEAIMRGCGYGGGGSNGGGSNGNGNGNNISGNISGSSNTGSGTNGSNGSINGSGNGSGSGNNGKEIGMELCDRVAFGCSWVGLRELLHFVQGEAQRAAAQGDIVAGVLLGGLNCAETAVPLLQHYVDRTGDVQTAALLALLPEARVARGSAPAAWVAAYRDLLNGWRLWEVRARLDVAVEPLCAPDAPAPRLFPRFDLAPAPAPVAGTAPLHPARLPNCCVCLLPLAFAPASTSTAHCAPQTRPGAPAPLTRRREGAQGARKKDVARAVAEGARSLPGSEFEQWWSWCQSCKHVAHTEHIREWFAHNDECPVTDCHCRCHSKDQL